MKLPSLTNIIYFCVGMLMTSIVAILMFNSIEQGSQKYVYLNIDKVIKEITTTILSKNLAQDKSQEEIEQYKKLFDKAILEYSKKHNVIIFSSPRPLVGAKEVTDHFIHELIAKAK